MKIVMFVGLTVLVLAYTNCSSQFSTKAVYKEEYSSQGLPAETSPAPEPTSSNGAPEATDSAALEPIKVDVTNPRLIETALSPANLNPDVFQNKEDEYAVVDTRVPQKGYLVLYLYGAGTQIPSRYLGALRFLASKGVHVICPNYIQNYGIATNCAVNDKVCLGLKRYEALTGIDTSPWITVSRADSVEERVKRMILFMKQSQPQYGWDYYLDASDEIRWDRVIAMGHSHGSGSVSYLGKLHQLARVVALSGPDDNVQGEPSDWMKLKGATPMNRYYTLLNIFEIRYPRYLISDLALGYDPTASFDVTNGAVPPTKDSHTLLIAKDFGADDLNHGSASPATTFARTTLSKVFEFLVSP